MYDFHCHLNHPDLRICRQTLVSDFLSIGGKGIIIPGVEPDYNNATIAILDACDASVPVYGCLGFHPCWIAETDDDELLDAYRENYGAILSKNTHKKWIAIGECGVDLYHNSTAGTTKRQQKRFQKQLAYASTTGLPIVVHSRNAFYETKEVLQEFPLTKIYLHCRTYDRKMTTEMLEKFPNVFFGCSGIVTYPKATDVATVFRTLPLDRIVLETDAPYLSPHSMRTKQNLPSYIAETYDWLATARTISHEDLCIQQGKNWEFLFSLSSK